MAFLLFTVSLFFVHVYDRYMAYLGNGKVFFIFQIMKISVH